MAPITTCDNDEDFNATSTLPRSMPMELIPQSSKAATLNKILRKTKNSEKSASSSSPLKILRDKSFSMGKPRLKMLPSVGSESINSTTFLLDDDGENPCETPSYMANAEGNFTMTEVPKLEVKADENNPLPLPPRDRNAKVNVPQKRHVRKHALIIPASGIQRTLNKVNQVTPVEEKQDVFPLPPQTEAPSVPTPTYDDDDDDDVFEDLKNDAKISQGFEDVNQYGTIKSQEKFYAKDFIENNFPEAAIRHSFSNLSNGHRTYENIEAFQKRFSCHDEADSASLHFESILENDDNIVADDLVDGFCVFESASGTKEMSPSSEASAMKSDRNPDIMPVPLAPLAVIESKKLEFSQKYPKYKMPRNELASNALFNKIKESVENASMSEECEVELEVKEGSMKSINHHVSCEDLLDFSDKKPKGRERGSESDEVRIMIKMFGTKVSLNNFKIGQLTQLFLILQVSLDRCLSTLNFTDWDLQKAIKLCKLQNLETNLSLQECFEKLEPLWDLNQIKN